MSEDHQNHPRRAGLRLSTRLLLYVVSLIVVLPLSLVGAALLGSNVVGDAYLFLAPVAYTVCYFRKTRTRPVKTNPGLAARAIPHVPLASPKLSPALLLCGTAKRRFGCRSRPTMSEDYQNHPPRAGLRLLTRLLLYAASLLVVLPLSLLGAVLLGSSFVGDAFLVLAPVAYTVYYFRKTRPRTVRIDPGGAAPAMPPVPQALNERRRRGRSVDRRKLLIMLLAYIPGGLLAVTVIGWAMPYWAQAVEALSARLGLPPLAPLGLVFPLGGMGLFMMVYAGLTNRLLGCKRLGHTVLWLRRFHQDDLFPFDLLLDDVCRGIAMPITVADTTVPNSAVNALIHLHWLVKVGAVVMFLGFLSFLFFSSDTPNALIAMVTVPPVLLGMGLQVLGMRRGGRLDLTSDEDRSAIEQVFDAVRNGKPMTSAMTVVRLSDENWQRWVGDFIARADAVILDVTHLNDNLGWELRACRDRLAPGCLVLACGEDAVGGQGRWSRLQPELERSLGPDFVQNCQRFTYSLPRWRWLTRHVLHVNRRQTMAWLLRRRHEARLLALLESAFVSKSEAMLAETSAPAAAA